MIFFVSISRSYIHIKLLGSVYISNKGGNTHISEFSTFFYKNLDKKVICDSRTVLEIKVKKMAFCIRKSEAFFQGILNKLEGYCF